MRESLLSIVILIGVFLMNSCGKKDDPASTSTTVAQDKDLLTITSNATIECAKGVINGISAQTLIKFFGLSNGTASNESWCKSMQKALENKMGKFEPDNSTGKFNYNLFQGKYDYDFSSKSFIKSSGTGIEVNMPSDPSKSINNVKIKITKYIDNAYMANSKTIYLPNECTAKVIVDGNEMVNLNYTGVFSTGSFPTPNNVKCNMTLSPHNYVIEIQKINNTQFSFSADLGGDCNSKVTGMVFFRNEDYNNFTLKDDLDKVEATYTKNKLKVEVKWDARTYYQFSNPSSDDINSTLISNVYNSGNKIGDLKFKKVNNKTEVFINYKDGTSENTAFVYDPFATKLKGILRPYFGSQVDNWFKI